DWCYLTIRPRGHLTLSADRAARTGSTGSLGTVTSKRTMRARLSARGGDGGRDADQHRTSTPFYPEVQRAAAGHVLRGRLAASAYQLTDCDRDALSSTLIRNGRKARRHTSGNCSGDSRRHRIYRPLIGGHSEGVVLSALAK